MKHSRHESTVAPQFSHLEDCVRFIAIHSPHLPLYQQLCKGLRVLHPGKSVPVLPKLGVFGRTGFVCVLLLKAHIEKCNPNTSFKSLF